MFIDPILRIENERLLKHDETEDQGSGSDHENGVRRKKSMKVIEREKDEFTRDYNN